MLRRGGGVAAGRAREGPLGWTHSSRMTLAVVAEAADGRIIQLPIKVLHPFISKQGIQGDFLVTTDDENRFVKIAPLKRDDSQGSLLDAMG